MNEGTYQILNRNIMKDLIGDEPDLIKQFEIDFLNQAKGSLHKMASMYNADQLVEITEEAHFLKTSAKAVGAERISQLLQTLEESSAKQKKSECRELILKTKVALQEIHGVIANDQ